MIENKELSKHKVYLKMCLDMAELSKCRKVKVASMIVYNGRIVSTGVNGTPKNFCNCFDHFKDMNDDEFLKSHSQWSNVHEVHSELNTILFAAVNGVKINSKSIMYCTHEPCENCIKHIAAVGIKQVFYIDKYYNNIKSNNAFGVNVEQIEL